jgi:YgiT-type zinc finger domain-containing protein
MTCDICGSKRARIRRVTRACGRGRATFLIENVPLVTCPVCGESYFAAETLKEIERIRLHRRHLTVDRRVPFARFGGAA